MTMELKFDEVTVDTSKAEDFLKNHSSFKGNYETTEDVILDNIGNKIYLSAKESSKHHAWLAEQIEPKLLHLAQLLEQNAELFCQLEYMIRKIPPADVKLYDLHLIVQNIINCVLLIGDTDLPATSDLYMKKDSPLINLGYAAQFLLKNRFITITTEPNTAVVCWLFADLCRQSGLGESVLLRFVAEDTLDVTFVLHDEDRVTGGCGVVSAKCDIDSALDALIDTPDRLPWSVKRILVQESILQRFQSLLQFKAKRNKELNVERALIEKCTNTYICESKVFLINFAGSKAELDGVSNVVLVEAYRTVEELNTLLESFKPFWVSLWSDSIREIYEIENQITSKIVWINCFGRFYGPAQMSEAYFSVIPRSFEENDWWVKLPVMERVVKIKGALKMELHISLQNLLPDKEAENFFSAGEKIYCAGVREKRGLKRAQRSDDIKDLLMFLIWGGRLVIPEILEGNLSEEVNDILLALQRRGAPVVDDIGQDTAAWYTTRVVWTCYGPIFAK